VIRYAADENFNNDIIRGLLRRRPSLDVVRVQDVGLSGADDASVLRWAASEGRIVVTHDVATMTGFVYERLARGEAMPGVVEVPMEKIPRSAPPGASCCRDAQGRD
jgi:predicted nuclease of predicted toxin-antitoxin system